MAGSLSHIVKNNGRFTMNFIDNLGDAHEALEECFYIILDLSGGDMEKINAICRDRVPAAFLPEESVEGGVSGAAGELVAGAGSGALLDSVLGSIQEAHLRGG